MVDVEAPRCRRRSPSRFRPVVPPSARSAQSYRPGVWHPLARIDHGLNELVVSHLPDLTTPGRPGSAGAVDVSAVLDANDDNFGRLVADSVKHPVGSTAGRPQARKLSTQRSSNSSGLLHQRRREELKYGRGDGLGKPISQGPTGRGREDEFETSLFAHRRRWRTASIPLTTSPRA
jgi:hypothetical protein